VTKCLDGHQTTKAQRSERTSDLGLQPADLLMAVGMVSGLLARSPAAGRRATAEHAWALLRRGIQGRGIQEQGIGGT